jgi:pyrroloquinoline quinone biosynthesis protein B
VSVDGARWLLLNASPDLRQQIIAAPCLHPRGGMRQSPICAVFVTNADVDHLAGLLTLREQQRFVLYGSKASLAQASTGVFGVLNRKLVQMRAATFEEPVDTGLGLTVTAFAVPGKVPLYLEGEDIEIGSETESTAGLEISDGSASFFYVPGCAKITNRLKKRFASAKLIFFDGTTYTDDELVGLGLSKKTAWRMGHIAMSGENGSLNELAPCGVARKIYVHINNTNPVLIEDSPERAAVLQAGWEVAYDGMEVLL